MVEILPQNGLPWPTNEFSDLGRGRSNIVASLTSKMHPLTLLVALLLPIGLSAQALHSPSAADHLMTPCILCGITCGGIFAACAFASVIPGMLEVGWRTNTPLSYDHSLN